jgi:hypothetical protein
MRAVMETKYIKVNLLGRAIEGFTVYLQLPCAIMDIYRNKHLLGHAILCGIIDSGMETPRMG